MARQRRDRRHGVLPGLLLANVAWGTDARLPPEWDTVKKPIAEFKDPRMVQAVPRLADGLGRARRSGSTSTVSCSTKPIWPRRSTATEDRPQPLQAEHYLFLNLAIGGDNGGDPSGTEFPAKFEVDYVRVFQQRGAGASRRG